MHGSARVRSPLTTPTIYELQKENVTKGYNCDSSNHKTKEGLYSGLFYETTTLDEFPCGKSPATTPLDLCGKPPEIGPKCRQQNLKMAFKLWGIVRVAFGLAIRGPHDSTRCTLYFA